MPQETTLIFLAVLGTLCLAMVLMRLISQKKMSTYKVQVDDAKNAGHDVERMIFLTEKHKKHRRRYLASLPLLAVFLVIGIVLLVSNPEVLPL